jgi:hypothetical protein
MISCNPARRVSPAAGILVLVLRLRAVAQPDESGIDPAVNTSAATSPARVRAPLRVRPGTLRVMLRLSVGEASAVSSLTRVVPQERWGWESSRFQRPVALTCDRKKPGSLALPARGADFGHYTQIRLNVSSATIFKNARTRHCFRAATALELAPNSDPDLQFHDVIVPSGEIKLNREFDLAAGGTTVIELDFDGDKSITQTGNGKYMMKPVIGIISVTVQ